MRLAGGIRDSSMSARTGRALSDSDGITSRPGQCRCRHCSIAVDADSSAPLHQGVAVGVAVASGTAVAEGRADGARL